MIKQASSYSNHLQGWSLHLASSEGWTLAVHSVQALIEKGPNIRSKNVRQVQAEEARANRGKQKRAVKGAQNDELQHTCTPAGTSLTRWSTTVEQCCVYRGGQGLKCIYIYLSRPLCIILKATGFRSIFNNCKCSGEASWVTPQESHQHAKPSASWFRQGSNWWPTNSMSLPTWLHIPVYLSLIYLSIYLHIPIYLSIYLSVVYLSICSQSIYLSTGSIYLSIYSLSVYL